VIISSVQNKLFKHFLKLSQDRAYREKNKSFLVFGKKLVLELSSIIKPTNVVIDLDFEAKSDHKMSRSLIKKISGQPNPEGIFAEFPFPKQQSLQTPLLVLDGIQDPGNMGTLLRSLLAFQWGAVVFLPGCVDPFSPKVVQAARGALIHIPYRFMAANELTLYLNVNSIPLYIADCKGESLGKAALQKKCALLLGNEGQGVISDLEGKRITIPTHPNTESLNVAVAGSIIMHQLQSYE
jgi:RNA methyltransferase, TrmH family